MKLNPCKCGGHAVEVRGFEFLFRVTCPDCGRNGPDGKHPTHAAAMWNERNACEAGATDTQRLDFLDRHAVIAKPGQPIREAIDAAMAASKGEK